MKDAEEQERYPTLSDAGRRLLEFMREHPAAPMFRNQSGNHLRAEEVEALRGYEQQVRGAQIGWSQGELPPWLAEFVAETWRDVPYFRALGAQPEKFLDLPTTCRSDLAADIAQFVPDSVPVDRLINFRTTGTTGTPLLIASHPLVTGRYLAHHRRALRHFGVELQHGSGQVGVVLIGHQRKCFTYISVTPVLDESGLAKINLHPDDWHDPEDRARYLDALAPEVIAGDPLSFAELLQLPLTHRPRALLSVSMALSAGLRNALEGRFQCPVLDIYSLNEVGPVAVFDAAAGGHLLLQPLLYVEILDHAGQPVAPGERGEVTLTGGFNFCMPLLRYRTGDHAALALGGEVPVLVGLAGRAPVRFRSASGERINNIDVTHALHQLALPQYGLHQRADGSLLLRLSASAMSLADAAQAALVALLGQPISVQAIASDDKIVQYSSELS